MSNDVTVLAPRARLPMPDGAGVDPGQWKVLVEAIFPSARSADSVMLALNYCKARNLDPFKRPVHIVPVYNAALRREVETVWPAIIELETTAARTGVWAGLDPPEFGPMVSKTFTGRRKIDGNWRDVTVEIEFPEWALVRVYRMVAGVRCPFAEPAYWLENYGRVGGSQLPNDQWAKRPRGMLTKVAKAFSLRAAFPEETGYSAEEMEGTEDAAPPLLPEPRWQAAAKAPAEALAGPLAAANGNGDGSDDTPAPPPYAPDFEDHDPDTGEVGPRPLRLREDQNGPAWRDWAVAFMAQVEAAPTLEEVEAWTEKNRDTLERLATEGPRLHARLHAAVGRRLVALAPVEDYLQEPGAQDRTSWVEPGSEL